MHLPFLPASKVVCWGRHSSGLRERGQSGNFHARIGRSIDAHEFVARDFRRLSNVGEAFLAYIKPLKKAHLSTEARKRKTLICSEFCFSRILVCANGCPKSVILINKRKTALSSNQETIALANSGAQNLWPVYRELNGGTRMVAKTTSLACYTTQAREWSHS